MESYHKPIIRLAQVSDANKLKDLNDLFNDKDDTPLNELETSLHANKNEIIVCADIGTAIVYNAPIKLDSKILDFLIDGG